MKDPKFLTGPAIHREVRRLMSVPGDAVVAVAFWGSGAAERTGIASRRPGSTSVLCDLFSGSCNPDEIAALLKAKVPVRTLDGMHAKVWCLGDVTIVGSANASANGLGFEGNELSGNVEAAVLVKDAAFAMKVRIWFDDLWGRHEVPVDEADVAQSRLLWQRRRSSRRRQYTRTALGVIDSPRGSSRFKKVKVIAYAGSLTREAEQAFKQRGRGFYEQQELARYDEAGVVPVYQDGGTWAVAPGDVFVDFHIVGKTEKLNFTGLWLVRDEPRIPAPSDHLPGNHIVLLEQVLDFDGIRLPPGEVKAIAEMLKAHAADTGKALDGIEVGLLQLCQGRRQASGVNGPT